LPESAVDLDAYLDSGAERSLLDGGIIVPALGMDLMAGERLTYGLVTGDRFEARIHRVRLSHPAFGSVDLEAGISTAAITRNILGRDFFDHMQIGFREHELKFFLTPNT
jgi:hypothetical protein